MSSNIIVHFSLMALGLAAVIAAFILARKKQSQTWLFKHRLFALAGATLALVGLGAMVYYKQMSGYPHLSTPHGFAGLMTIALLVTAPVLGYGASTGGPWPRRTHRLWGRSALVVMALAAITGGLSLVALLQM